MDSSQQSECLEAKDCTMSKNLSNNKCPRRQTKTKRNESATAECHLLGKKTIFNDKLLFRYILALLKQLNHDKERTFKENLRRLRQIDLNSKKLHLNKFMILEQTHLCPEKPYQDAITRFEEFTKHSNPVAKFDIIAHVKELILDHIDVYWEIHQRSHSLTQQRTIESDEFASILVFFLIRAQKSHLQSHMDFVRLFYQDTMENFDNEGEYIFTTVEAMIEHVTELTQAEIDEYLVTNVQLI